ncbi:MAG: hypothetical protein FWF45_02245 [Coriobacteriia bacterium]|nr:hypothetical protein [Coriobacteriia bacterium]
MKGKWQTIMGGVMAFLTCSFAVWRFFVSSRTIESLMTNLIAICGTIVSLLVLLVAIKAIVHNMHDHDFATTLGNELNSWGKQYYPLVFVDEKNRYEPGENGIDTDGARYRMLTEHRHILRRGERPDHDSSVIFFDLPPTYNEGDKVLFYLRKSMFKDVTRANHEDPEQTIAKLSKDFANAISSEFSDFIKAHGYPEGTDDRVTVIFNRNLHTPDDARLLVKLLSYVTILYLAVA